MIIYALFRITLFIKYLLHPLTHVYVYCTVAFVSLIYNYYLHTLDTISLSDIWLQRAPLHSVACILALFIVFFWWAKFAILIKSNLQFKLINILLYDQWLCMCRRTDVYVYVNACLPTFHLLHFFVIFIYFFEDLLYSVVLVSAIQQCESACSWDIGQ